MRERELKHRGGSVADIPASSLPMRERELKLRPLQFRVNGNASLPMRECELKRDINHGAGT